MYDNNDLKVYAYQEGEKECKHTDNYVCWSAVFQQKMLKEIEHIIFRLQEWEVL